MRCAVFDTLDQQALPTIKSPLLILALIVIHVATSMDMEKNLMGDFGRGVKCRQEDVDKESG